MAETYLITDREPQALYHFFEDISKIPRVTFNEKAVSQYLVDFANKRKLWCYQDAVFNVLIKKGGSKGCEDLPPVLLEGHVDMVAAKREWSNHNFDTDPIELVVEGNILRANGTTLGADNGCAVAIMLMLLDSEDLVHPPLECLFTTQEETNLDGMRAFDLTQIKARRVIGLDAGEEGVFRTGTTTKTEITAALLTEREELRGNIFEVTVDGLRGGTQGENIPKERICAIKMTARVLHFLNKEMDVRVVHIEKIGTGVAENCRTMVSLVAGEKKRMMEILGEQQELIRREYRESDPDIRICAMPLPQKKENMLKKECSDNLINSIYMIPHGARNRKPSRLSQVSCSVAIRKIYTEEDGIRIFSVISAEEMVLGNALSEELRTFLAINGWKVEQINLDHGWDSSEDSPIRESMRKTYVELFGKEPIMNISHGGNDCVVLKHRIPEMDVVTTAATYKDCHTPNEHLYMDSFEKVYYLLEKTLFNLVHED